MTVPKPLIDPPAEFDKKYGMIVADNGGDWRISVAPDQRIKGLDKLRLLNET